MDMEQQSDLKLIPPSGMGYWFVEQDRTPLVTLVCQGRMCQRE